MEIGLRIRGAPGVRRMERSRHAGIRIVACDVGVTFLASPGVNVFVLRQGLRCLAAGTRSQCNNEPACQNHPGFVPAPHHRKLIITVVFGLTRPKLAGHSLHSSAPYPWHVDSLFSLQRLIWPRRRWGHQRGQARLGERLVPHTDREVQRLYDDPQQFAEDIYDRIEQTVQKPDACMSCPGTTLRLIPKASAIPEVPARYFGSSDRQIIVAAHKAEPYDRAQLLRSGGGKSISSLVTKLVTRSPLTKRQADGFPKKELLAEVLGAGRDARDCRASRSARGLRCSAAHVRGSGDTGERGRSGERTAIEKA